MPFDVTWVGLDLRRKHKIWLISKRGGSARSDLLTNGATLRKLSGGSGVFGNRVVGEESWRQLRPWRLRGDVHDGVWRPARCGKRPVTLMS
jgi:hypothetical protein